MWLVGVRHTTATNALWTLNETQHIVHCYPSGTETCQERSGKGILSQCHSESMAATRPPWPLRDTQLGEPCRSFSSRIAYSER